MVMNLWVCLSFTLNVIRKFDGNHNGKSSNGDKIWTIDVNCQSITSLGLPVFDFENEQIPYCRIFFLKKSQKISI